MPRKIANVEHPLLCPFCDMPAYRKPHSQPMATEHEILLERLCPMGHSFVSIETVPQDIPEAMDRYKALKRERYLARKKKDRERYAQKKLAEANASNTET